MLSQIGDRADDIALIRTVHGEQFNHHPGQLLLSCGKAEMGRPSIGAWLTYGLGTESDNLPGYVVLAAGRGASGGSSNWTSGFLPSQHQGVELRSGKTPVRDLFPAIEQPKGSDAAARDFLQKLNAVTPVAAVPTRC